MLRNLLTPLILAIAGLSIGSWFLTPATGERELQRCADRIGGDLRQRQQEAQKMLANLERLFPADDPLPAVRELPAFPKDISFQLYGGDSLLFWSDRQVVVTEPYLDSLKRRPNSPLVGRLSTGVFLLSSKPATTNAGPGYWISAILIKKQYGISSTVLAPQFVAGKDIPSGLTLTTDPPGAPILNAAGETVLYLQGEVAYYYRLWKIAGLFVLILAFTGLFRFTEKIALKTVKEEPRPAALALFPLIFLLPWWLVRPHIISAYSMPALPGGNLADFTAGVLLLLGMVLFIFKNLPKGIRPAMPLPERWSRAAASYALIALAFTGTFWFLRSLVLGIDPFFDLNALFPVKTYSLLALFAAITLEFSILLLGWWLLGKVSQYRLSPGQRLSALLVGLLAGIIPAIFMPLDLPLWAVALTTVAFLTLLDLLVDFRLRGLTPLVIWLVLLSAFTSVLLFKYQLDQDWQRQLGFARNLAHWQKPVIEQALNRLADQWPLPADTEEAESYQQIDRFWLEEESLYSQYNYRLSTEGPGRELATAVDSLERDLWKLPSDRYWLRLRQPAGKALWLEAYPIAQGEERLLPAIFPDHLLETPAAYDYAVYNDGRLLKKRGQPGQELLAGPLPAAGESRRLLKNERAEILYHDENGTVVLLSRFLGGYGRPLSLFSLVFVCLLLAAVIFLLADRLYRALPFTFHTFPFISLRNRIQVAVLALIIGSFLLVGWVTASFFTRSTAAYRAERTRELLSTLQRQLQQEQSLSPEQLVARMAGIHHRDFDLFDQKGNLLASSARPVYQLKLTAPRMDYRAWQRLRSSPDDWIILPGTLGQLSVPTAYLRTRLSGQAAFTGMPLVAPARDARQDFYEFLATLINVYVFLLLLASAVALAVANSITKPLEQVGTKLSDLQLESNEPIEWQRSDEIGQLISAYNRMIDQLSESTEKLRQSEREGAWREMAQQVAHEIKGRLTPMKLSIQHLDRIFQGSSESTRQFLRRVINTLVEQIDSLARIATAFYDFARMPTPKNEVFSLSQLASSVYDLYLARQSETLHLNLQLPTDDLKVFADRDQVLRVINNLLENAIQALAEDRIGIITMSLKVCPDQKVRLSVEDNGNGIPEDVQPKVFYPSFTTKNSGMGLGLAMCKQIIETANGIIAFETRAGSGTVFFFELPLVE